MFAEVGIAVCVGAAAAMWVAGALYNALRSRHSAAHAPRQRTRSQSGSTALVVVAAACAGLAVVSRGHVDGLTVEASWARVLGLAVLVASTVFTLWARFSLGTMWSMAPKVKGDHQLRTRGPYAVTRHPTYTGVLGMLLGATLRSGIGQWIVLFPAALIVFEVKIRMEEHLMLATFPGEYPRYRAKVPQLVPGLYVLRQRPDEGDAWRVAEAGGIWFATRHDIIRDAGLVFCGAGRQGPGAAGHGGGNPGRLP